MNGFSDIVGNRQIKEHLYHAIQEDKPFHAYIFQGDTGTGKKMMAKAFAAGLQCCCEGERPCGDCVSCRQIKAMCHPDVIWLKKEKAGYGVEEIREQINHDIQIRPYANKYKVFLMNDAETMTESAQNALLKTIEEPPEYAVIILMTNNINGLLPTIRSRCMNLEFGPITTPAIEEYLLKHCGVPDYLAKSSALFAQGNLGKAIRYASSADFLQKKELIIRLLRNIHHMSVHEVLTEIKVIAENKDEINDYIDLMMIWYRDVLLFKATKNVNQLLLAEEYLHIIEDAKVLSYYKIEEILTGFDKLKVRLRANVNFEVAMELMLLNIKE